MWNYNAHSYMYIHILDLAIAHYIASYIGAQNDKYIRAVRSLNIDDVEVLLERA